MVCATGTGDLLQAGTLEDGDSLFGVFDVGGNSVDEVFETVGAFEKEVSAAG